MVYVSSIAVVALTIIPALAAPLFGSKKSSTPAAPVNKHPAPAAPVNQHPAPAPAPAAPAPKKKSSIMSGAGTALTVLGIAGSVAPMFMGGGEQAPGEQPPGEPHPVAREYEEFEARNVKANWEPREYVSLLEREFRRNADSNT